MQARRFEQAGSRHAIAATTNACGSRRWSIMKARNSASTAQAINRPRARRGQTNATVNSWQA